MKKHLKLVDKYFMEMTGDDDYKNDSEYRFYQKFFSNEQHTKMQLRNAFGGLVNQGVYSDIKNNKLVYEHVEGRKFGKVDKDFFAALAEHVQSCGEMDRVIKIHDEWEAERKADIQRTIDNGVEVLPNEFQKYQKWALGKIKHFEVCGLENGNLVVPKKHWAKYTKRNEKKAA